MPNLSDYDPAVKYGANLDINVNLADVRDQNNNEILEFNGVSSAVGYIQISNCITGNNPIISATAEADTGLTFTNDQGEELLILDANATAVNEISIDNAATGANPTIAATGDDTNISMSLTPKGTGLIAVGDTNTATIAGGSATINAQRGILATTTLSAATASSQTFDLKNNKLTVGCQSHATITRWSGTTGLPVIGPVFCNTAGSATIYIINADSSPGGSAINGTASISFIVLS